MTIKEAIELFKKHQKSAVKKARSRATESSSMSFRGSFPNAMLSLSQLMMLVNSLKNVLRI